MDKPGHKFLVRFILIGLIISTVILFWLVLTPSLSNNKIFLSYSPQRVTLISLVVVLISALLIGLYKSKNDRLNKLFIRLLLSKWFFLLFSIISFVTLTVCLGTVVYIFGKWSMIFNRLQPISLLVLLLSLEFVVFQIIYSGGKIRYPILLGKIQPILKEENQHQPDPIKQNILLYLLVIFLPIIITIVLVSFQKPTISNFRPRESDEIFYWHEIASFKDYGFQGGNFSFDELTAPGIFSHFGGHGPVFAVTYGMLGRLVGWSHSSGPIFNIIIISLSLASFLAITRPIKRQSIVLMLILGLFFPLIYYIPTIMQESLNFAIAILLCAFLVRFSRDDHPPLYLIIGGIVTLFFAAALRVTWVITAFPMFYFLSDRKSKYRFIGSFLWALAFSLTMAFLYTFWTSEYPVGFLYSLLHQNSLKEMIDLLLQHLQINAKLIFRTTQITGFEIVFQYQFFAVIVFYAINRGPRSSLAKGILFMLCSIFVFMFIMYDFYDFRPMRTMASFLLISLLSLAFFTPGIILKCFIRVYLIACILTVGYFYQQFYDTLAGHFEITDIPVEQGFIRIIDNLKVNPKESPWCNSLLTSYPYFNEVRFVPPGIGINLLLTEPKEFSIKSHYVFLPTPMYNKYSLEKTCKPIYQTKDRIFCIRIDDSCDME